MKPDNPECIFTFLVVGLPANCDSPGCGLCRSGAACGGPLLTRVAAGRSCCGHCDYLHTILGGTLHHLNSNSCCPTLASTLISPSHNPPASPITTCCSTDISLSSTVTSPLQYCRLMMVSKHYVCCVLDGRPRYRSVLRLCCGYGHAAGRRAASRARQNLTGNINNMFIGAVQGSPLGRLSTASLQEQERPRLIMIDKFLLLPPLNTALVFNQSVRSAADPASATILPALFRRGVRSRVQCSIRSSLGGFTGI